MNSHSKFGRVVRILLLVAVVGLSPLMAFAQDEEEEDKPRSYVLGYALTTLAVGLGVFVVVRPGKRRFPKIKRQDDDEDDLKPKGH